MKDIPIYKEEKSIAKLIKSNRTLSYCQKVEPAEDKIRHQIAKLPEVAKAEYTDRDLYYHQSILVSTAINLNTDVFLPEEVWAARNTPTHKPTNLNHNELDIVGHIVANFAVDKDYELIDDNSTIDELPSTFHILTSSVIYQVWEDEDKNSAVAELIEKIEAGEMYVSMEAIFNNFDYLLYNDSEQRIIARNNTTAFLTRHLRSYGGDGKFQDYNIGRILRNITFSGKGYVENPANPESVVFSKDNLFNFSSAKLLENNTLDNIVGVSLNEDGNKNQLRSGTGVAAKVNSENKMAEDIYQKQAEKLEADNKALANEIKELKDQLSKADISKYESKIEALEKEVANIQDEVKSKSDELTSASEKIDELTKAADEATKAKDELQAELNKVEAERVIEKRTFALTEVGVGKEDAEKIVAKYSKVDNEVFADVVETQKQLVEARTQAASDDKDMKDMKDMKDKKEKDKKDKKEKAEKTEKTIRVEADTDTDEDDEEVKADLNEVEEEDKPNLSIAAQLNSGGEDALNSLRKAIASSLKGNPIQKYMTESK